jgi:hypothetical protein
MLFTMPLWANPSYPLVGWLSSYLSRKLFQIVFVKGPPILSRLPVIQQVMVIPERILIRGTLTGLGRPLGFRSQECHVQIAEAD